MGRNHRSTPGGAGVDPQRGGAAKKDLDPYIVFDPQGGPVDPYKDIESGWSRSGRARGDQCSSRRYRRRRQRRAVNNNIERAGCGDPDGAGGRGADGHNNEADTRGIVHRSSDHESCDYVWSMAHMRLRDHASHARIRAPETHQ